MRFLELKVPPPLVALMTAVLMWLTSEQIPAAAIAVPLRLPLALCCAAIGAAFDLTSLVAFIRARTTINPLKPAAASALVNNGLYRHTRNPMYCGLLLILLGWATYLANVAALLCLPLFVLYLTRFQIIPEERVLAEKFGKPYAEYKARVPRWLW
jgi:protein-S-isoprenylcysteine O-methyltransferase Ste14